MLVKNKKNAALGCTGDTLGYFAACPTTGTAYYSLLNRDDRES
jgi:hypothetical protein